jgi:hypothetical protein
MREKRELTNAQARELVFERMLDGQEYECVKEITKDNGRWDLWIQNTFKNVETEEYWRINWTRGKTEQQDYHSLQGDGTHDLHPVEKRMVVTEKFVGANYKPSGHHVILEFDDTKRGMRAMQRLQAWIEKKREVDNMKEEG